MAGDKVTDQLLHHTESAERLSLQRTLKITQEHGFLNSERQSDVLVYYMPQQSWNDESLVGKNNWWYVCFYSSLSRENDKYEVQL